MNYEKIIEGIDILIKHSKSSEEVDRVIQASMVDALFYIAKELHELNKNIKVEVDDGR